VLRGGADCVFVPDMGNLEKESIWTLVEGIARPINVIAGEKTPSIPDLETIVVGRLSFGPMPMRTALARLRATGCEGREDGTFSRMNVDALSLAAVNG